MPPGCGRDSSGVLEEDVENALLSVVTVKVFNKKRGVIIIVFGTKIQTTNIDLVSM